MVKELLKPNEILQIPGYAKVRILFQTHAIFIPEDIIYVNSSLAQETGNIFRTGQRNIIYMENNPFDQNIRWFHEGYLKYKSFTKGFAYMSFIQNENKPPNEGELDEYAMQIGSLCLDVLGNQRSNLEMKGLLYFWTVYNVFDRILAAGIDIDLVHEKGLPDPKSEYLRSKITGLVGYKAYYQALQEETEIRNRMIAGDLSKLVANANKRKRPINIFVLLGRSHHQLAGLFPDYCRHISKSQIAQRPVLPEALVLLHEKLAKKEEATEEEWYDAMMAEIQLY